MGMPAGSSLGNAYAFLYNRQLGMGVKDSFLSRLLGNADKFTDAQITQTIDLLIASGVERGASDIHIEPHAEFVWVRYRIGGQLHGLHKLPLGALTSLLIRLKELAEVNPAISVPQEGTFQAKIKGQPVAVRLAAMPVVGGEKVVLHLSAGTHAPTDLRQLGFWGVGLSGIESALARAFGLVIVASPKHSGRPATLYSLLELVHTPGVSVMTVEDPIEHRLNGVTQTSAGGSIANGLKAVLNQDPNIVMVSDLPDLPAAALAVQAGTNGHLIVAGMHAESAPHAIARLKHMGVEPFLLAASLKVAISQHTARKLCLKCRERYVPAPAQAAHLDKLFGMKSPAAKQRIHTLEQQAAHEGIGKGQPLSTTSGRITHLWRPGANGCDACHHSGYSGHTLLTEVIVSGSHLHDALMKSSAVSVLHAAAVKDGFVPLGLDGLIKSLRGETTITEVLKATASL